LQIATPVDNISVHETVAKLTGRASACKNLAPGIPKGSLGDLWGPGIMSSDLCKN